MGAGRYTRRGMGISANRSPLPPPLVALAGWIFPGAGYWLIGQRTRALTVGITILILFFLGILIGGVGSVDAPSLGGPDSLFAKVLQKPWFIGQVLAGPISLIAAWIAAVIEAPLSHARVMEIGTLYSAVAGMLNLMAIIDSASRASREAE